MDSVCLSFLDFIEKLYFCLDEIEEIMQKASCYLPDQNSASCLHQLMYNHRYLH